MDLKITCQTSDEVLKALDGELAAEVVEGYNAAKADEPASTVQIEDLRALRDDTGLDPRTACRLLVHAVIANLYLFAKYQVRPPKADDSRSSTIMHGVYKDNKADGTISPLNEAQVALQEKAREVCLNYFHGREREIIAKKLPPIIEKLQRLIASNPELGPRGCGHPRNPLIRTQDRSGFNNGEVDIEGYTELLNALATVEGSAASPAMLFPVLKRIISFLINNFEGQDFIALALEFKTLLDQLARSRTESYETIKPEAAGDKYSTRDLEYNPYKRAPELMIPVAFAKGDLSLGKEMAREMSPERVRLYLTSAIREGRLTEAAFFIDTIRDSREFQDALGIYEKANGPTDFLSDYSRAVNSLLRGPRSAPLNFKQLQRELLALLRKCPLIMDLDAGEAIVRFINNPEALKIALEAVNHHASTSHDKCITLRLLVRYYLEHDGDFGDFNLDAFFFKDDDTIKPNIRRAGFRNKAELERTFAHARAVRAQNPTGDIEAILRDALNPALALDKMRDTGAILSAIGAVFGEEAEEEGRNALGMPKTIH